MESLGSLTDSPPFICHVRRITLPSPDSLFIEIIPHNLHISFSILISRISEKNADFCVTRKRKQNNLQILILYSNAILCTNCYRILYSCAKSCKNCDLKFLIHVHNYCEQLLSLIDVCAILCTTGFILISNKLYLAKNAQLLIFCFVKTFSVKIADFHENGKQEDGLTKR